MLLAAQVALSGLDGNVPKKKLNLFELTSCLVAQTSTFCADRVEQALLDHSSRPPSLTIDQITFGLNPFHHVRPAFLMARNSGPEVSPAGTVHSSIALFTQSGTGTVRM